MVTNQNPESSPNSTPDGSTTNSKLGRYVLGVLSAPSLAASIALGAGPATELTGNIADRIREETVPVTSEQVLSMEDAVRSRVIADSAEGTAGRPVITAEVSGGRRGEILIERDLGYSTVKYTLRSSDRVDSGLEGDVAPRDLPGLLEGAHLVRADIDENGHQAHLSLRGDPTGPEREMGLAGVEVDGSSEAIAAAAGIIDGHLQLSL